MAKEYSRKCPDCDGIDVSSLFNKGDGRCKACDGEGMVTDVVRALGGPILDFPTHEPCKICSGTGQCQMCGGTGYQYYDSKDYEESGSIKSSSSSSESSGELTFSDILGVVLFFALMSPLVNWYNSCQNKRVRAPDYTESRQTVLPPVVRKPHYNQHLLDGKWVKKAGLGGIRNEDGLIISFENDVGTAIYVPPSALIEEGQILWKNFNSEKNWIEVYVNLSGGYLNSGINFIDSKTIKINFDTFKRK